MCACTYKDTHVYVHMHIFLYTCISYNPHWALRIYKSYTEWIHSHNLGKSHKHTIEQKPPKKPAHERTHGLFMFLVQKEAKLLSGESGHLVGDEWEGLGVSGGWPCSASYWFT